MARSLAQSDQAACPHCGHPIPLEIWLVVDLSERPDLAERIRQDMLHSATCPQCGHPAQVDAPLLVHDPERRRILFAPPQHTSPEEDRQLAEWLVGWLAGTFAHPRPDYLARPLVVPGAALPAMLDSEDPQAALESLAAGLEELRQQDPEAYRQLEQAAAQAMAQASPMLGTLQSFIQADTWAASRQVAETHPELLGDEADALLDQLIRSAQALGDEEAARIFGEHRALLQRCREVGTEAAFAEKAVAVAAQGAASLPGGGLAIPPEFGDDLRRAQAAEARYRRSGDREALDEAAATWQRIWDHPAFARAALGFRLAALNDGGGVFLRRYWASGQLADLSTALRCWEAGGGPDARGLTRSAFSTQQSGQWAARPLRAHRRPGRPGARHSGL